MPNFEHHQGSGSDRPQPRFENRGNPNANAMEAAMNNLFPAPKQLDWDLTINQKDRDEIAAQRAEAEKRAKAREVASARQAVHESFAVPEPQLTQPGNVVHAEDLPQEGTYALPKETTLTGEGGTKYYFAEGATVGEAQPQEKEKTFERTPAPQPSAEELEGLASKLRKHGRNVTIHPGGYYEHIGEDYRR